MQGKFDYINFGEILEFVWNFKKKLKQEKEGQGGAPSHPSLMPKKPWSGFGKGEGILKIMRNS